MVQEQLEQRVGLVGGGAMLTIDLGNIVTYAYVISECGRNTAGNPERRVAHLATSDVTRWGLQLAGPPWVASLH